MWKFVEVCEKSFLIYPANYIRPEFYNLAHISLSLSLSVSIFLSIYQSTYLSNYLSTFGLRQGGREPGPDLHLDIWVS